MGLLISDEELELRLNSPNNLINRQKDKSIIRSTENSGKRTGQKNLTLEEKTDVGVLGNLIGTKATRGLTGCSQPEIDQLKNGEVSHLPNEDLTSKLEASLGVIREKAVDRLMASLDRITDDRLDNANLKELATV